MDAAHLRRRQRMYPMLRRFAKPDGMAWENPCGSLQISEKILQSAAGLLFLLFSGRQSI